MRYGRLVLNIAAVLLLCLLRPPSRNDAFYAPVQNLNDDPWSEEVPQAVVR